MYVAQPNGGRATEFRLVRLEAGTAVFENLAHDFEVDTFRESARYVGPDGENVMPLSELFPLYVGRIVTASTDGRGRENVTFRVLTSAAPVVLAQAPTLEDAKLKVRRLSAKLGLEVAEIPEKTEHMKPWETDF